MKKLNIKRILIIIVTALIMFWFLLPPLNPQTPEFWSYLVGVFIVSGIACFILGRPASFFAGRFSRRYGKRFDKDDLKDMWQNAGDGSELFSLRPFLLAAACFIISALFALISSSIFHAGTYANRMVPENGVFEDLPTSDDVDHISLMDTNSARILGDRVIGSLTDLVSQFEVSDGYTTLVYNDTIIKAAPLEYGGFFKFVNNYKSGVPGYVKVDTQSFDATFVRTAQGMKYMERGYFFNYLPRHLRIQYPFAILGTPQFEIDEEGLPYCVTPVYKRLFLFQGDVIKGAVITDPSSGESNYYDLGNIPDWVDNVLTGNFACSLYDAYGSLRNGWLNSVIGQKGCLKTTDDFGYLAKGNDLFIYTGVTSVNADESNLGFIMVNARTGICTYVECAGAEEYSAMTAAQGAVQNYGYQASFPSLVTVDNVPTYVMVLKDSGGLVKEYAAVNVNNYTIVSVSTSLNGALKEYRGRIAKGGATVPSGETISKKITVASVVFADTEGNTYAYLIDKDDVIYKIAVAADETVVAVKEGDVVTVEYTDDQEGYEVILISSIER
ncbi:MAG: hypothetical protein KBS83_08795 [Lachnospiraceae bacterium]|nr:hypothetical protein [Candidatus Equihabitans merdae]